MTRAEYTRILDSLIRCQRLCGKRSRSCRTCIEILRRLPDEVPKR